MIVQDNVKCSICGKIFCCLKCRCKHEQNSHEGISCPICNNHKIFLCASIDSKLVTHIVEKHLPLRCVKCAKVYHSASDIVNITKCIQNKANCGTIISASSLTQPSVYTSLLENKVIAPTSMVQLQWKIRNKLSEDHVGESLSSLKNLSFINHSVSTRNENKEGTVVRTTSTPMQGAIGCKQKETVFDSSGSHVSSIYASGSEYEISPPIIVLTPSPKPDIMADRLSKYTIGLKKPVTPLRQVISNSIRRAITEHGMENFRKEILQSKRIFDHSGSPLDLRTSPALRRVQSEIIEKSYSFDNINSSKPSRRKSLSISSKKTTESILIKSTTKSSVYTTCRSISVITSTELQEVSVEKDINKISTTSTLNSVPFTPKVGGVKKKKTIDFETPIHINSVTDDDDDVFYTPMSIISNNTYNQSNLSNAEYENIDSNICIEPDKSNRNETNTNKTNSGRKLWSMMTSMIHIPGFVKQDEQKPTTQSFIKRCASFAGYITKPRNPCDDNKFQSLKRRRNTDTDAIETVAKRLKRIQGRKPINRMRNLSINNLCKTKM